MDSLKILILNGKADSLPEVLSMANTLNSKSGPFACALLLGSSLNDTEDVPDIKMELPTYISNGSTKFADRKNQSYDLKENLTLLNGFGFIKLANGLQIGYMAAASQLSDEEKLEVGDYFEKLSKKSKADILLSYDWSVAISQHENLILGDAFVDQIVSKVKPKYHFSGKNGATFSELEPFAWDEQNKEFSRFINVAEFNSGSKWAYAFRITLDDSAETCIPDNLIDNPYEEASTKRALGTTDGEESAIKRQRKSKQVLPSECRFCLSNTKVEEHMIISISKFSYITIAKGPLSVPQDGSEFSGHCLIIPIEHMPKLNSAQQDMSIIQTDLFKDMMNFESSITQMNYKKFDMSTLVFEINSSTSIHFHKQILPIAKYLIGNFDAALSRQVHLNNDKFKGNAKFEFKKFEGYQDEELLDLIENPETNYFQFTIRETHYSEPVIYISTFEQGERIDLQFGRRVAAFLLKQPKRTKWDSKICLQSKIEEEQEVLNFQKAYKSYDFTLK